MLNKYISTFCCLLALWIPVHAAAIYIGNQTFSMAPHSRMVAKYVINNNKEPRLYRITVRSIDSPGQNERDARPPDGELLFSPRQLTLQPETGEFFKFFYHGPNDAKERYYRVSFEEIPTQNRTLNRTSNSAVSLVPVIVMDSILVVRPRDVDFKWLFDRSQGVLRNNGNTWFRLLFKPDCTSTEAESDSRYLRPGDTLRNNDLKSAGIVLIIYNDKYISVHNDCS